MIQKLFLIILLFISCNSSDNNDNKDSVVRINDSVINNYKNPEDSIIEDELNKEIHTRKNSLSITGNDIWVRDKPSTGEVILKLNEGDLCEILDTGMFQIIKGQPDFWYKIQFDDKEGWVFGSQTNIKNNSDLKNYYNDLVHSMNLKIPEQNDENLCFVEIIANNKSTYLLYFDSQEGDYSNIAFVSCNDLGKVIDIKSFSGVFDWKKDYKKYEKTDKNLFCFDVGEWVIDGEIQKLKTKGICLNFNTDGTISEK